MIDVGQGDSTLIVTPHTNKAIMIDTGGKISWKKESWEQTNKTSSIAIDSLIPFMRNIGINKLDYLILTHGDQDHAGEAQNLIDNFNVNKVYINKGEINNLENNLTKKEIINFQKLKIDNIEIYSLNNKVLGEENDDSIVLYIIIDNFKFLFMGDASIKTEDSIMNKYSLNQVDILKVGHHGSKTSSSKEFINKIKPKYSIISVGKNNRYGHPNQEILNTLQNSKIYRTDINGSISLKINKNKLKIETCIP